MRKRLAAALATILVASCGSAASASSSGHPTIVLGGSVTLTGSDSYERDVIIPRAVTIDRQQWLNSWHIDGPRGRFAGYVLRQAGRSVKGALFALSAGFCLARACAHPDWVPYATGCDCGTTAGSPSNTVLPAGRYHLYLIADGAPVTVAFTLPGLKGRTTIRSGQPHPPQTVYTPAPAVADPPIATAGMGANRYSAGVSHTSPHGGLYVLVSWKLFRVSPPKSVSQFGACFFHGPMAPGPLGPYEYPCGGQVAGFGPGGQVETGPGPAPAGALAQYGTDYEAFGSLEAGPWSIGSYINSMSPASEAHTQVFWLNFPAA
jgi:hypothetical protein